MQRQVGLGQNIISASSGASEPVFKIGNLSKLWLIANARETVRFRGDAVAKSVQRTVKSLSGCRTNFRFGSNPAVACCRVAQPLLRVARRQTSYSGGRDMSAALGWQHEGIEVDQCTQNPRRFIERPTEQYLNGM
jgi:hypothetical protein